MIIMFFLQELLPMSTCWLATALVEECGKGICKCACCIFVFVFNILFWLPLQSGPCVTPRRR